MGITKEIICLETGEIYPSVRAAAEALHYSYSYLREAIKSKKALNGRHLEYTGNINSSPARHVKDLETGEIYRSQAEAAEKTGLSRFTVYNHLHRRVKKRRFTFVSRYVNDRG